MLVYCSFLTFEPTNNLDRVISAVARWIGKKTQSFIDPAVLQRDLHQRLKDGSTVDSVSSSAGTSILCAISFTHRDYQIAGRQWITEIGIRQEATEDPIDCSILLRTNEVSSRVVAPIQVTRPRIVEELVKECSLSSSTPGFREKRLDEQTARSFHDDVENGRRQHPYIVVSPTADGQYIVTPPRLASLLMGVADIVVIPPDADTFEIERLVGSKYSAWRGAVNVIFAPRKMGNSSFVECVRLLPNELIAIQDDGGSPDTEVLSVVTHRTNLPNSWLHISPETVVRHRLRAQLSASIVKGRASSLSQQEYVQLLGEADKELRAKEAEISSLHATVEEKDTEARRLEYEIQGLKSALSARDSVSDNIEQAEISFESLKDAINGLASERPSLEQALHLVRALHPDRVTILESAYKSAKESANFKHKLRAFHLLWKLVTEYWVAMHAGAGDGKARQVFGDSFAAKEAESISKQGLKRRTFPHNGKELEMLKHLRIGVKDSASETLRIHFHWDADEQRILIGYCGKHLAF